MKPTLQREQRLQKYANTHPLHLSRSIHREPAQHDDHGKKPPLSGFIRRPGRSARAPLLQNGERPH